MNNVRLENLKNCIFMEFDDFADCLKEATNGAVDVSYSLDGLMFHNIDETADEPDVNSILSAYFDVTVTSVHADDADYVGVWIVYKNNTEPAEPAE